MGWSFEPRLVAESPQPLEGLRWHYWNCHWAAKGQASYGDHLMFERFYDGLSEEVDTLAEKLVGLGSEQAVVSPARLAEVFLMLQGWSRVECPYERSLKAEEKLQELLSSIQGVSLGMEDFLGGLANGHETNIYLLRRRLTR